jgi:hypothetical protein
MFLSVGDMVIMEVLSHSGYGRGDFILRKGLLAVRGVIYPVLESVGLDCACDWVCSDGEGGW